MNKITPLQDYRISIDLIDKSIINLLTERMRVVSKVGRYKKENDIPALDATRWQQVISAKKKLAAENGLSQKLVSDLYERIHQESLRLEKAINLKIEGE